jgi:hypothetical protein
MHGRLRLGAGFHETFHPNPGLGHPPVFVACLQGKSRSVAKPVSGRLRMADIGAPELAVLAVPVLIVAAVVYVLRQQGSGGSTPDHGTTPEGWRRP